MQDCIFCKIITKQIKAEIVLEKEYTIVIKDIYPKAAIHLLVIPKKHLESIKDAKAGDSDMLAELFLAAKALSLFVPHSSDFKLVVNNGTKAGQHVFHLHMHFLAGLLYKEQV